MTDRPRMRQEVLNTTLAKALNERGVLVLPEKILEAGPGERRMPDLLFDFRGIRVMVECEIAGPNARRKSLASATERVEEGLAAVAIALVHPASLAEAASVESLEREMKAKDAGFELAVVTELGASEFCDGDLDRLHALVENAWRGLLSENALEKVVSEIDEAVRAFSMVVAPYPGMIEKFATILGIQAPGPLEADDDDGD